MPNSQNVQLLSKMELGNKLELRTSNELQCPGVADEQFDAANKESVPMVVRDGLGCRLDRQLDAF